MKDIIDGEFEELSSDLEEGVSQVSESVVSQGQEEAEGEKVEDSPLASPGLPAEDLKDKYGRPFDPQIHVADVDGKPVVNKGKEFKGCLKIRPGVKAPNPTGSQVHIPKEAEGEPEAKTESTPQEPEAPKTGKAPLSPATAGAIAAKYTETIGVMLGGDEWRYIQDKSIGLDEAKQISESFAFYFEQKGVKDISPGWLLAIVLMNYGLLRFRMPQTRKRLSLLKYKIKSLYYWIKGKKLNGTWADPGNDGERKDDVGQADMPKDEGKGVGDDSPRPSKGILGLFTKS